jgi:hypothetical protein
VRLGVPILDDYLRFVAARVRPNTVLATAYDLAVFFRVVRVAPLEVSSADVLRFITAQRTGSGAGCGWSPTVRDCRHGRCAVGCPASRGCSRICWRG